MKLLFDQNLSPRLVQRLADPNRDSNHVYNLGIEQATDHELRGYAGREGFTIVTKDSDFSDLFLVGLSAEGNLDAPRKPPAPQISKKFSGITNRTSKRLAATMSWEF